MSIRAWGAVGGVVSLITFRFLKHRFGGEWALGFLALIIVAWIALCFFERRQMERLHAQISRLDPEEREPFIRGLDPKIQADLRKMDKAKSGES